MKETNPFPFFIPAKPEILIVGSFPCFNGVDYGHWFYSGSGKNHFWDLLSEVYGLPATTKSEKKKLCERHGIALSDVAFEVERTRGNCSDSNLRIISYNKKGLQRCLKAGVSRIIFTGTFAKKHFNSLFPGNDLPQILLVSPSPAASKYIGGLEEYKRLKTSGEISSAYEYRLSSYRKLLLGKD